MGDAANMALDHVIDEMCGLCDADYPFYPSQIEIACKYCGKGGFRWRQTTNGWRLFDINGKVHGCHEYYTSKEKEHRDHERQRKDTSRLL